MEPRSEPVPQAPAGWYPDFWTPSRKRYWTGSQWTFATKDAASVDDAPPLDASTLPKASKLPPPVVRRPAAATAQADAGAGPPAKRQRPWLWVAAVVVGLLVGVAGIFLSNRSGTETTAPTTVPEPGRTPTTGAAPPSTAPSLSAGNDPSAAALESLIVKPEDVPATSDVIVFPGGVGLGQPTLDLCNGRYPSESRRTARIQDAVLDVSGALVLSTEAVLYADSGGTSQAFAELQSVVAACPPTAVPGPAGEPPVATQFHPAPDSAWPQTPTVNRLAYDFMSDDGSGAPRRTVAVYLQRGRALLGVYFPQPDGPQEPVEGRTTIEGIVALFAERLAALPTSVVGA